MNWYYARLRWAVMVEGAEGLRRWEEAVHIFQSGDRAPAWEKALEIGRRRQAGHEEGRRWVETRLAEVVMLECLGPDRQEFEVELASQKPATRLPFEHVFHPERTVPAPIFRGPRFPAPVYATPKTRRPSGVAGLRCDRGRKSINRGGPNESIKVGQIKLTQPACRSSSVCILTAALCLRNLAHGNGVRHRSMVVESSA